MGLVRRHDLFVHIQCYLLSPIIEVAVKSIQWLKSYWLGQLITQYEEGYHPESRLGDYSYAIVCTMNPENT